MNKLICNSLIASVVAVAGATTFAGQANAQSADVPFTGTVPNTCTINKTLDGKIGIADKINRNDILSSRSDEFTAGQLGEVEINCNTSGLVSIGALQAVSGPAINLQNDADPNGYRAELYTTNSNFNGASVPLVASGKPGVSRSPNGTAQKLYVHMVANKKNQVAIPGGSYQFKTTVTITPQ